MHRLILASILLAAVSGQYLASAQEAENSIGRLREQVAKLESMDRDGGLPENIRGINRDMLAERRTRLRALIEQRIGALVKYRSEVASMLSLPEARVLENSIQALKRELQELNGDAGSEDVPRATLDPLTADAAGGGSAAPTSAGAGSPMPDPPAAAPAKKKKGNPDVQTIPVDKSLPTLMPNPCTTDILTTIKSDDDCFEAGMSTLINGTINGPAGSAEHLEKDDYAIVHIVSWVGNKVRQEGWFLFKNTSDTNDWEQQTDFDGKRIYGSKRVAVLLIHVNAPDGDISYKVAVNKKTPAPFKNLMDLIGALSPKGGGVGNNLYGGKLVIVEDVPSDIVVSASIAIEGQQNKEFTRTYDNEGRYHWDVSIGLPVKTFRELQFNSDGNKVTATAKERQDVYGFLNVYPVAVDVKANDYLTFPHLVFGVPLASKPLHHPFVGIGTGVYKTPIKFNIFAGVTFNRERVPRTLQEGQSATTSELEADLRTRWVRKFTFGINLPVGQIKDAIKK